MLSASSAPLTGLGLYAKAPGNRQGPFATEHWLPSHCVHTGNMHGDLLRSLQLTLLEPVKLVRFLKQAISTYNSSPSWCTCLFLLCSKPNNFPPNYRMQLAMHCTQMCSHLSASFLRRYSFESLFPPEATLGFIML